ncbi:hypothetical protein D9757_004262 [Collybiopsis confluens]|uniref:RanBD1 domain-containing protein n=1 Tax=Collybiopsis confluens TaxID=2823264 RepID=A0A8H5HTP5_9AGAR|nr:hypothetical protein D9757_004262 [Collybiopsis confluens]
MSSSSVSRSPSPHTPSPIPVDNEATIATDSSSPAWPNHLWVLDSLKSEDSHMLQLDDLIEQHAYEDAQKPSNLNTPSFRSSMPAATKPVPPPPTVTPRSSDHSSSRNSKVVHPPKDSCFNLPIIFPSIPEGGTKSRVETQIRITVDLADPSSSSDPHTYDRVGSWKWLKLPPGAATKKRTRKQGKIDPDPLDTLYITTTVSCATPPHNRVLSCSSCQSREAKRVAKKIAARVRPAHPDSDSPDDPNDPTAKTGSLEDTSSIIQFNCAQVVDFSTGSAVLPLRITCYCRHHREKTGFNLNFVMMDSAGRTVGVGSSSPIMITDDHKTTSAPKHADLQPYDWCQPSNSPIHEVATISKKAPSKRKLEAVSGKKRVKPYDSSAKPSRGSRETSVVSSAPSPAASEPSVSSTSTPPPADPLPATQIPPLQYVSQESESSPDVLTTPLDPNLDISMLPDDTNFDELFSNASLFAPSQPLAPQAGVSPGATTLMSTPASLPFLFNSQQNELTLPMPTIHRLIPNCGPTHGGIEVTVLGANFHPTLQFNCVFGEMRASSTQRWSDNTLVCILPPRSTPGMVSVWFEGFPKDRPPSFFTYADESDRALMELALRVVGLKMTGQLEDAKNVAMRIIGAGEGSSDTLNASNGHGATGMNMQLSAARDLRSLMLLRAGESEDFESLINNFLKLIDTPVDHPSAQVVSAPQALSHTTSSGQSLLHLATFLGYGTIVDFLIQHGIDLDMRDRNGFTALHFAAITGSKDCVVRLLRAGADHEIVNAIGKTAAEVTREEAREEINFDDILEEISESSEPVGEDDEEADWGDAEEDAEEEPAPSRRVKMDKRARRSWAASRRASREELHGHHLTPKTSLTSVSVSTSSAGKTEKMEKEAAADEKQALSFIDMLQRTMAQLPGAPQLPFPLLPLLPGVPAVPWESLHQLQFPMVFPVAVPLLPGWLGGEHREGSQDPGGPDTENAGKLAGPFKAAQEWRAMWERWLAHVPTWQQATEMPPPPQYTPRAPAEEAPATVSSNYPLPQQQLVRRASSGTSSESELLPLPLPTASGSRSTQDSRRRYDYSTSAVTDQEVEAYAYQPKPQQQKHDRMLLLFWLPILMMRSFGVSAEICDTFGGCPDSGPDCPKKCALRDDRSLLCLPTRVNASCNDEEGCRKANYQRWRCTVLILVFLYAFSLNFVKEDMEDGESEVGMKKADDAVLATRVIKGLPKRAGLPSANSPSSESKTPPPKFQGFGTGASSPFQFTSPASPSPSPFSPAPPVTSNPFGNPAVSASASSAAKTFSAMLGTSSEPRAALLTLQPTLPEVPNSDGDVTLEYYKSLRGLNTSILSAITKALDRDPFEDVSFLLDRYKSFRSTVQTNFEKSVGAAEGPPPPSAGPSMPVPPTSFRGFGEKLSSSATATGGGGFTPQLDFSSKPTTSPFPANSTTSGAFTFGAKPKEETAKRAESGTTTNLLGSPAPPSPFNFASSPKTGATNNPFGPPPTSNILGSSSAAAPATGSPFGNAGTAPKFSGFGGFGAANKSPSAGSIGNPVGFGFGSPTKSEGFTGGSSKETPVIRVDDENPLETEEGVTSSQETQPEGSEASLLLFGKNPHDEEGEGEEDEQTVHFIRSKAFRMKKGDNGSSGWADLGTGVLRIKKHKDTGQRRILLRNSNTGKIIVNFNIYNGLKPTQNKKALMFVGHENGVSQTYNVRTKTEEQATELKNVLEREIAFVKAKQDE